MIEGGAMIDIKSGETEICATCYTEITGPVG
jgi:hypothetical protein